MHIKHKINAQNLRLRKEYYTSATSSGMQFGVTKSRGLYTCVLVPINALCEAFRMRFIQNAEKSTDDITIPCIDDEL